MDLDARPVEVDAGVGARSRAIGSSRPTRMAVPSPWLTKDDGGADDLLLLALGEDDALGLAPHALDRCAAARRRSGRAAPRAARW